LSGGSNTIDIDGIDDIDDIGGIDSISRCIYRDIFDRMMIFINLLGEVYYKIRRDNKNFSKRK
jgi:hypothetical protein